VDDPLERFAGRYDQYYRNVMRYALQNAEQGSAEDVVSEAFLIAWRRWPRHPGAAAAGAAPSGPQPAAQAG
jgi:RNA polymerase sigma-70 factor (ECF subfamily)